MNMMKKLFCVLTLVLMVTALLAVPASAAAELPDDAGAAVEETADGGIGMKAIASGLAIGIAAAGGAIAMGLAVGKAAESVARQPEADGKVRTTLMLGLVFIETAIIYALLVVILIIFVL